MQNTHSPTIAEIQSHNICMCLYTQCTVYAIVTAYAGTRAAKTPYSLCLPSALHCPCPPFPLAHQMDPTVRRGNQTKPTMLHISLVSLQLSL